MNDCVFCKINNKEIPCYSIYEDEIVNVFLSNAPISNGHTLVVPKKHYLDFNDIDLETLNHINIVAKKMAILLKERLNYIGLQLVQNNGVLQEVKHYHLHLIPKYENETKEDLETIYNKLI